jgi:hypothetical protein
VIAIFDTEGGIWNGNCTGGGNVGTVVGAPAMVDILLYNLLNIDPAIVGSGPWVIAPHILYDAFHITSSTRFSESYNSLVCKNF